MPAGPVFDTVRQVLRGMSRGFAQDELAYLCMTSKVESPIRDKTAWMLQNRPEAWLVAREYPLGRRLRADVAVLNQNSSVPSFFIEFKLMYSYEATVSLGRLDRHGHRMNLRHLLHLLDDIGRSPAPTYGVLLVVHPFDLFCTKKVGSHNRIIHYLIEMNDATRRNADQANGVRAACEDIIGSELRRQSLNYEYLEEIYSGNFFGTRIQILCWLIDQRFQTDINGGRGGINSDSAPNHR